MSLPPALAEDLGWRHRFARIGGRSVRRRFAFTVGANLLRASLSFLAGMALARWLGPQTYGDMAFLIGTFVGIRALMDLGSSTAFFTFVSQRPRSKLFVRSYFVWLAVQFVIVFVIIWLVLPAPWISTIWHGARLSVVLLALVAAFVQYSIWPSVQQAGESQRQTLWVQTVGVAAVGTYLITTFTLWKLGRLSLPAVFMVIAGTYLLAAVAGHANFRYATADESEPSEEVLRSVIQKFLKYCRPMVPYSFMSFANTFADRWLLQNYGGGVQQAYYAVGAQFAAVGLIATTSILSIFWKEVAEAHHQKDHAREQMVYRKVSRLLFLVGAAVAGFLIPWATELLRLTLGAAYAGGAVTLAIMFLYPVHQSMGQIGLTMLYATEKVWMQVVTGVVLMTVGICLSYLVLAPRTARIPGLGLGSEGVAIKMVVVQIIGVNIIAYLIARTWKWSFDWVYQPLSLGGCVALGWLAHVAVSPFVGTRAPELVFMGAGGFLYLAFVCVFVYVFPGLAGLSRSELENDFRRASSGARAMLKR